MLRMKCVILFSSSDRMRILRRSLTSSQVSVALRPFYFLVHPDLFGKFPEQQRINENSLKTLKTCLDGVPRPGNVNLDFYLKQKTGGGTRRITLRLGHSDVKSTVLSVLTAVQLPTSYVDSIVSTKPIIPKPDIYNEFSAKPIVIKKESKITLPEWLSSNVEIARTRLTQCIPSRLEIERLIGEVCRDFELKDVAWDCDLDTLHRRGALDSFLTLIKNHEDEVRPVLRNKVVTFGRRSGYSLKGDIVLFSGEIRYNWLNVIKRVPSEERELRRIPSIERSLSESLRNIRISHREFQPLTLVDDYRIRLRHLITSVNDYRGRRSFPDEWPDDLSDLVLCVEAEASPLMVAPSGEFIVPASTPGFLLVKFISDHRHESLNKLKEFESRKQLEESLIMRCINELGLIELGKDDSITRDAMIACCEHLLSNAIKLRHLTHGNHLIVTRYYSVQSDGSMCIPYNWNA